MNQVPTTVTAVITALAALPAQMLVAWAAKSGYTLGPGFEQSAAIAISLLLGMASQRLAVINQAVDDVVAAGAAALVRRWSGTTAKPSSPQSGFAQVSALLALLVVFVTGCALHGCGALGDAKPIVSKAPEVCVAVGKDASGQETRTVNDVCAAAAEALNQANALLAAVDRMTLNNVRDQVWTHEQALPFFEQTGKLGQQLDSYQALFVSKKYAEALSSTQLTKTAILALQRQVSAQSRKQ